MLYIYLKLLLTIILISSNENCVAENVNVIDLGSNWSLRNANRTIEVENVKLPSGIYSAVTQYGEIINSKNDIDLRWLANDNWTFTKTFEVDQADFEYVNAVNLTVYGIDTISTIRLNKQIIGQTSSMFVTYSFNILPYLLTGARDNTLEIEITSPIWAAKQMAAEQELTYPPHCQETEYAECHGNMLRKMQTSFGGKWTLAALSMGIWKPIVLEYYDTAILRYVDVATDKRDNHWLMDIRVILSTPHYDDYFCDLTMHAAELLDAPFKIKAQAMTSPIIEFDIKVAKERVQEWWPNGYGNQKLYPLYFSLNCWHGEEQNSLRLNQISKKTIQIGFRTIELVEDSDENGRSFYFKVNEQPIFIKGATYLPAEILPEHMEDTEKIKYLLESAKNANFNLLRLWGGGIYESDYFYSLADLYGLLIWQDMSFSASTYPFTDEFVENVRLESIQNAQRIAYHPSLMLLVTNDEIELYLNANKSDLGSDTERLEEEYKRLFQGTIKYELNVIARTEFNPRPMPLISTPSSQGYVVNPQNAKYGDVHFWPNDLDLWNPKIYPKARFISQYGAQSLPNKAAWQHSLKPADDMADLMQHRQRSPMGMQEILRLIERHFPLDANNWSTDLDRFIYMSQLAQAMAAKVASDVFRSNRIDKCTMGAIYWHLNDVWIAPSSSLIDYHGTYKIAYYWAREFFAPTYISTYASNANEITVTILRDNVAADNDDGEYNVTMNIYLWSDLYVKKSILWKAILDSNGIEKKILRMDSIFTANYNTNNSFLEFILSKNSVQHSRSLFFPGEISKAVGVKNPELVFEFSKQHCYKQQQVYFIKCSITLRIQHPAVFVYIGLNHPSILKHQLSDNGFVQMEPIKIVHLEFEHSECLTLLDKHIKVLHLNQYLVSENE